MKYTKLKDIQNPYPGNSLTVENSYNSSQTGIIQLTGKYPDNFLTFDIISVTDETLGRINVDPNISIRFLVKFLDADDNNEDDYWTSQGFLNDLENANQSSNPYFNRELVTVAEVDFQKLRSYWKDPKFVGRIGTKDVDGDGEKYAEVEITETLDTKHEMLLHIDWLVSSKENLRDVSEFGNWNVVTTSQLGFSDEFFTGLAPDLSTDTDTITRTGSYADLNDRTSPGGGDRTPSSDTDVVRLNPVSGSTSTDRIVITRDGTITNAPTDATRRVAGDTNTRTNTTTTRTI